MKKRKKNKILVIHGPNLHLLGKRQPNIYGKVTLNELNKKLYQKATTNNIDIEIIQSNSESKIVDKITNTEYDFLIINPAAFTHTSVAIKDAILAVEKPTIEVHLSNIYKREDFRKHSVISDAVLGVISGFKEASYFLALDYAISCLKNL
ncbi:MAG: type II 3-dehydroquinate dehydratase [Candidatus Omnitrophica bacterium]|nr:type II 3-dehydroquinate dehydratase [Candidatus Omnitrophota bacterium]